MSQNYQRNCSVCRIMRSMAFSGIGAAIGAGGAFLLGANRQDAMMAALVCAAVLVFGLANKNQR